ncbi:MAG: helix-turn-helix domain-containing protein [Pseudonocardiaceae bacterium]
MRSDTDAAKIHPMSQSDVRVPRRQLGQALRTLRTQAGVTRAHAAGVIDCAESKIGHIENGVTSLSRLELEALLQLYDAPIGQHEALEELRAKAKQRRSRGSYRLPRWLRNYLDMESDASSIRSFDGELIPGILQTEAYARRVHLVAQQLLTPDDSERLISTRIGRQRLVEDGELAVDAIVSEAAFRRLLGDGETAIGQLLRLIELVHLANVSLHVIPFGAKLGAPDPRVGGLHPSMSGCFAVLRFPDDVAPPFGYLEHAIGGEVVDDQKMVSQLDQLWDLLRKQALTATESSNWLEELSHQAER